MVEWVDGWMDGWMDGRTSLIEVTDYGSMEGSTDGAILFYSVQHSNLDQSNYHETVSPIQSQRKPGCDKKKVQRKKIQMFSFKYLN